MKRHIAVAIVRFVVSRAWRWRCGGGGGGGRRNGARRGRYR